MLATTLLMACANPVAGTYVGTVGSLSTDLGIVTNDTKGRAYVAGGADLMDRQHAWIDLKIDGAQIRGADEDDHLFVTGRWKKDRWEGQLKDADDLSHTFILFAPDDKLTGLYEADSDSSCPVGAVVLDKTLQGVYCSGTGADATYAQLEPVGELPKDGGTIDAQTDTDPPVPITLNPAKL